MIDGTPLDIPIRIGKPFVTEICSLAGLPLLPNHAYKIPASHRTHDDPDLTKLHRTGITAAPLDWLPDVIRTHCQIIVERYEEAISKADEDIVLDGVRRAFNLVKAQACMLATLFIPAIHKFLLPELKKAWHGVLKKREGLVGSHSMSRVNGAAGEIDVTILFFEDLIKDLVDHCKILDQSV
jgi:hypothetical protein